MIEPKLVIQRKLKRSYVDWNGIRVWFYHTGYADGGREVRYHPVDEYGPATRLTKAKWKDERWLR